MNKWLGMLQMSRAKWNPQGPRRGHGIAVGAVAELCRKNATSVLAPDCPGSGKAAWPISR